MKPCVSFPNRLTAKSRLLWPTSPCRRVYLCAVVYLTVNRREILTPDRRRMLTPYSRCLKRQESLPVSMISQ